jgi:competence protein ComEC
MVEYKDFCLLLAGDLTISGEKELLKKGLNLKADILKIGHHGAEDSTSEAFLKQIRPSISVISVNRENLRGYPSQETLERIKVLGSQLYKTDRDGTIIVAVKDKEHIEIRKENEFIPNFKK